MAERACHGFHTLLTVRSRLQSRMPWRDICHARLPESIGMRKAVKVSVDRGGKFCSIPVSLRGLARDQKGVTAMITALGATALIGFTGLAIDVASWEVTLRKMQGAADQAALAALTVANAGGDKTKEAKAVTASDGFVDGHGSVAETANQAPSQVGHP